MPRKLPWLNESPTPQGSTLPEAEDPFASDNDTDKVIDLTQDDKPG